MIMTKGFSGAAARSGFSLVELSIVLVILGLLTGGILTGQNLIRAAELRSVVTEFKTYQTAFSSFRDKYFSIPGDMQQAERFWPVASGCGAQVNAASHGETCSGDGDGKINLLVTPIYDQEVFWTWQHLALAGLIPGSYSGRGQPNATDVVVGSNIPQSKIPSAGWNVYNHHPSNDDYGNYFNFDHGNFIYLGAPGPSDYAYPDLFTPEEAWSIDKKVDDGKPARGKFIGLIKGWRNSSGWDGQCTTSSSRNDLDADYRLEETAQYCNAVFIRAF